MTMTTGPEVKPAIYNDEVLKAVGVEEEIFVDPDDPSHIRWPTEQIPSHITRRDDAEPEGTPDDI